MKIRITTIRQLPEWDVDAYCSDMARNGVPPNKVLEFKGTGRTSVIMGNPNSAAYQITSYEIIEEVNERKHDDDNPVDSKQP